MEEWSERKSLGKQSWAEGLQSRGSDLFKRKKQRKKQKNTTLMLLGD